jgi:hypothetical protein
LIETPHDTISAVGDAKAWKYRPFPVAPTAIEPANRGPGRSRRIPDSPFLYGLSRFQVPVSPFESRLVLRNPLDGR